MDNKHDIVNSPRHYRVEGLENETMDIILALIDHNNLTGREGSIYFNVLKYLFRFNNKSGIEDLKKAEFYLNRLIRGVEAEDEKK